MNDFKLHLPDTGDPKSTLSVKAECTSVGEAREPIDRSRIDQLRRESLELATSGTAADVDRLGDEVFAAFFPGSVRDLFLRALARTGEGLRIVVVFPRLSSADPSLHEIAWETVRYDGHPLAQDSQTPLVRYYEQARQVLDVPVEPPLRVLLTAANADAGHALNLEAEITAVETVISELNAARRRFQLTVHRKARLEEFRPLYLKAKNGGAPFHVWHHCGHASLRGGSFHLAFETARDRPQWVGVDQLNKFLSDRGALRLALLNVCYGSSWHGLASGLAALNVPLTVGYSSAVADEAALRFIRTFYTALPDVAVDVAVNQAREELSHDEDPVEWTKAILFSRNLSASPLIRWLDRQDPVDSQSVGGRGSVSTVVERVDGSVTADARDGGNIDQKIGVIGGDLHSRA